jgi:hypothetical protein
LFSSVSTDDDDALPVEYCSTSASGEKKTDIHVHSVPLVSELNCNYNTLGKLFLYSFVDTFLMLMPHLFIGRCSFTITS